MVASNDEKGTGGNDPSDLDEFSQRLDRLRGEERGPEDPPPSSGAAWGRALRASSDLLAGLLVGTLLGYFLDRWLETSPWFLLAGIGVGFAAGLRNLMRSVK